VENEKLVNKTNRLLLTVTGGCMYETKFAEILKLLELQKQALTDLALDLVTAANGVKVGERVQLSVQKAVIFRHKIERRVRELSATTSELV